MFCPNCGKSNPDDSRFCESCGTNMLEAPAAPVAPPPVQTTYQQPAPTPQPVAYQPVQQAVPQATVQGGMVDLNKPLGVGGFFGMFAINLIPFVGSLIFLIMLFVWAFGSTVNQNKKNLARALLLWALIALVVVIILMIALGGVISSLIEDLAYQMY
ncbi:MAG: zinc ribbon domain-containing protein [Saccharofermentanales bacterium]|jgi:hypothetical protein|nr:zinc-ribbon domain-containing protein [Clostridiaceae bacterium]